MIDGAWLPWPVVRHLARLDLDRPSTWRIFILIATTAARYGTAILSIEDIVRSTGLGPRTVKRALAELIAKGFVVRDGRYRRLTVPMLSAPPADRPAGFTGRQTRAVEKALRVASMLTLADASKVALAEEDARSLGLDSGVTFGSAFETLKGIRDPGRCRAFVGMVIDYRRSERVAGRPI